MDRSRGESPMERLLSELAEDIVAQYERSRVRILADLVREVLTLAERVDLVSLLTADLLEGDDDDGER